MLNMTCSTYHGERTQHTTLITHNIDRIDTRYRVFSDPEMHLVPSVDIADDQVLVWMTVSLRTHVVSVNPTELFDSYSSAPPISTQ